MKTTANNSRLIRFALSTLGLLGLLTLDLGPFRPRPLEIYRGPTNFWYAVSPGATVQNQVWVRGGTTPYRYQWRFKGDPIPWATNSIITLTNVQMADAGPYDVVVTDAASASVTSDVDELEIDPIFEVTDRRSWTTRTLRSCASGRLRRRRGYRLAGGNSTASWRPSDLWVYRNDGPAGLSGSPKAWRASPADQVLWRRILGRLRQ